jgi:hypothetical protein
VLVRLHSTFHAFFESVQGGSPALLPDLASLIRELRERRLTCPHLPPAMQRLLGGAEAPAPGSSTPQGGSGPRGSSATVNASPVMRLQIGPGRNLGSCIRTAATAGDAIPLTDDGRRNFCLAYHYVGRCNQNCGSRATHRSLSRSEEQRLHAWKVCRMDPPVQPPAPATRPRAAPVPQSAPVPAAWVPAPAPRSAWTPAPAPRPVAPCPLTPGRDRAASPGRPASPSL